MWVMGTKTYIRSVLITIMKVIEEMIGDRIVAVLPSIISGRKKSVVIVRSGINITIIIDRTEKRIPIAHTNLHASEAEQLLRRMPPRNGRRGVMT